MKILLSIKPEYAEKILTGEKRYEFRRCIPKAHKVTKVVIYATKPIGKVVGEFSVDNILSENPANLWKKTSRFSGISKAFFDEYFLNRTMAHAIEVKDVNQYETALELTDILASGYAPQSFCYLP